MNINHTTCTITSFALTGTVQNDYKNSAEGRGGRDRKEGSIKVGNRREGEEIKTDISKAIVSSYMYCQ